VCHPVAVEKKVKKDENEAKGDFYFPFQQKKKQQRGIDF
jgi:hypothetical protein